MIPALIMGVLTNLYIASVLIFVGAYEALFSPAIGTVVFLVCFFLMNTDKISAQLTFLIVAYCVAFEVAIHTYFLGWDSGFIYFMFLLPIVFLLNTQWEKWMIIFFNSSIVLITFIIFYLYHDEEAAHLISAEAESFINLFNVTGTGLIVVVIMLYFSQSISKKDESLMEANIELERQNVEISAQHEHQKILLKEIHHRVKNNLQIISSLMSLQRRAVADKEVVEVLNDSRRRVEAIALIHQKLYQDNRVNRVDFKSYLEEIMESQQEVTPHIKCNVEAVELILNLDTAVPLGLIISEMIVNSIKHAFGNVEDPELNVILSRDGDDYELILKDNGIGFPLDFDLAKPQSLGTEIIIALTDQIKAKIEHSNDNGAQFKISFREKVSDV